MSEPTTRPASAQHYAVAVIGAGLSGLVAATELIASGVSDVIVIEAQDRVGGRLEGVKRDNGSRLMRGGEYFGAQSVQLKILADSLGVESEMVPMYANVGKYVRMHRGERIVEAFPFESDPVAAEALAAAAAAFQTVIDEVPGTDPWNAPRAVELDRVTFGSWLEENITDDAAREAFYASFMEFGDPHEISLLYVAWHVSSFGGLDNMSFTHRFIGGTVQIPELLAAELGDRVLLSAPVRKIERRSTGIAITTDRGTFSADAVIMAMEPGQSAKIEYDPELPAARDRLQTRWLGSHGFKIVAIYDRPFWREQGLAGVAMGPGPIQLAMDVTPTNGDEGMLGAFFFASNSAVAEYSDTLGDTSRVRELVLENLENFFGPQARDVKELHLFDWSGNRWSDGCSSHVPVSVLSSLGRSLREPVGRLFWAGAEAGATNFMEGAVTAGQRAAAEAAQSLR